MVLESFFLLLHYHHHFFRVIRVKGKQTDNKQIDKINKQTNKKNSIAKLNDHRYYELFYRFPVVLVVVVVDYYVIILNFDP